MKLERWAGIVVVALALGPVPVLAQTHEMHPGKKVTTVEIRVTEEGFVPSNVTVKLGEPLKLVVTRKTEKTCAKEFVIRDMGIYKTLPLDRPVVVEITPRKPGPIHYSCAMGMVTGQIFVE